MVLRITDSELIIIVVSGVCQGPIFFLLHDHVIFIKCYLSLIWKPRKRNVHKIKLTFIKDLC